MAFPRVLLLLLVVVGLASACPCGRKRCCVRGLNVYCCFADKGENDGVVQLSMGPAQAVSPFNAHARSCSGSVCSANGESRCCPLSEGSCCGDGKSCCGKGTTCAMYGGVNLCLPHAELSFPVATMLNREQQGGCVDDSGCPAGSECHGVIDDTKGQCVSSAVPILAEVL
ncbi:uncharacterized protein LOC144721655 isoform X1 [Lampetra planeri]